MPFELSGYTFQGAFASTSSIENRAGVYLVYCRRSENDWRLVDVGEAADVRTRLETHDRADCWKRNCAGGAIWYAAHYTPGVQQPGRIQIEQKIRKEHNPPCGKQ